MPKAALVWLNLRIQPYYLSEPICCPSVASSPFGFILPAQRQRFFVLHVSLLCEYCLGASLAETNQSAGCNFPYETRGMLDICDGILEVFPWPAMLPVRHHWPPPLWGGTWPFHHHGFVVTTDRYGDDSVHGGPLTS